MSASKVRGWRISNRAYRWAVVPLLMLGLLAAVAGLVSSTASPDRIAGRERDGFVRISFPSVSEAEPFVLRPLTPAEALKENEAVPISTEPLEPAHPFGIEGGGRAEIERATALDCLTAAVYYEAAIEDVRGQRAVAQAVLNRVRHPAFPASVCGVVYQGSERPTGCQFTFTCDGSLARKPSPWGWARARAIAKDALSGKVERSIGMATHYHANYVVPYWASTLTKIAVVGAHIFYRWQGSWGRRLAFNQAYAGEGQDPSFSSASLTVEADDQLNQAAENSLISDSLGGIPAPSLPSTLTLHNPVKADEAPRALAADEVNSTLVVDRANPVLSSARLGTSRVH